MRATSPVRFILVDLITLTIFGEAYSYRDHYADFSSLPRLPTS
jgi:hypothetical protein